ncbi:hypothetical protein ACMFMG_000391 [Clarireedia jacksonii]
MEQGRRRKRVRHHSDSSIYSTAVLNPSESDSSSGHETRRRKLITSHSQVAYATRLADPIHMTAGQPYGLGSSARSIADRFLSPFNQLIAQDTQGSPKPSVFDDSEFSWSSSDLAKDSDTTRSLANALGLLSLLDEGGGAPERSEMVNPQRLPPTKHKIPHLQREDFSMWCTDLTVNHVSIPSPPCKPSQQCPQNGERSPEVLENRQNTADTDSDEKIGPEDFVLLASDKPEKDRTSTDNTQTDGAILTASSDTSVNEERGRHSRRRGSSDTSSELTPDTAARMRKIKGKHRRERTGSSDDEKHWTRITYGCILPKKRDSAQTRQKYINKLRAGQFDGSYEELIEINRILDQMENPEASDPFEDVSSDSLDDEDDVTKPFSARSHTTENIDGDYFVRDPGPAPRSPVARNEPVRSVEQLHDEAEIGVWRGREASTQPPWMFEREENNVLVVDVPFFYDESSGTVMETRERDHDVAKISAQEISQQALASSGSRESQSTVADEVNHTQSENKQDPDDEETAHLTCRQPKKNEDCFVNTVHVPAPGLNVWMDCFPDQNLRQPLQTTVQHISIHHGQPKTHDPILAYIQSTTSPMMHLRVNGEKRSSQLQDASEDYAVVRKLAETTGRERWWEFCIEDIQCAVCDKLVKDQRRRDRVSCSSFI